MRNKTAVLKYRFGEVVQKADSKVHQMYFYDDIRARGDFDWKTWSYKQSETSAKYIRDQLAKIPDADVLEVHINSRGGEVGEGVTIYNLLRQKAQKGCKVGGYVDGYAYSVAADIAMGCDELHMGLGTTMLLHFPWMLAAGNAADLRSYADQLDAMGDAAVQLYLSRSGGKISEEELRVMMKKETVLSPDDCLKYGFCECVDTYQAEGIDGEDDKDEEETIEELKSQLAAARNMKAEVGQMLESLKAAPAGKPGALNTFLAAMQRVGR